MLLRVAVGWVVVRTSRTAQLYSRARTQPQIGEVPRADGRVRGDGALGRCFEEGPPLALTRMLPVMRGPPADREPRGR